MKKVKRPLRALQQQSEEIVKKAGQRQAEVKRKKGRQVKATGKVNEQSGKAVAFDSDDKATAIIEYERGLRQQAERELAVLRHKTVVAMAQLGASPEFISEVTGLSVEKVLNEVRETQ